MFSKDALKEGFKSIEGIREVFLFGEVELSKESYYNALNCPDGISNPYIHFSLGQVLYELEDFKKAKYFF